MANNKTKNRMIANLLALATDLIFIVPSMYTVVLANEINSEQSTQDTLATKELPIYSELDNSTRFAKQEKLAQEALVVIQQKYGSKDSMIVDVALILIGIGAGYRSSQTIRSMIAANKGVLTRVIRNAIYNALRISISAAFLDVALTIIGTSLGWVIAKAADLADGRNDNYIFA